MGFIRNGHSTIIALANVPTLPLILVEKTVTPPGIEGGGPINITNMRNDVWRTQIAKNLLTLTNLTLMMQFDPTAPYASLQTQYQVNQAITITFPDAHGIVFYGWLESISLPEHKEGEEPLATVVFCPSNIDGSGAETGPAYF